MDKNKGIIEHEYKENCFILTSFVVEPDDYMGQTATPTVSFLYRDEQYAAEWEVQYGPIQMWEKAEEGEEGAKEHYVYPFIKNIHANWSQLGVERAGLKGFLQRSEFNAIFNALKHWAVRE